MFSPATMEDLRIVSAGDYTGEGIRKSLARGLLVYYGDCNLTGEGMGIGSIALRDCDCTFFSRSWKDFSDGAVLSRTFSIDTRMGWGVGGKASAWLTRWIEAWIGVYMLLPRLQGLLMRPADPLRSLLGIHPVFETVRPRGSATFTYRVYGDRVDVEVRVSGSMQKGDTLCLLNELSASWFTAGWERGHPAPPPPGWEKYPPSMLPPPLFDAVHELCFSLEEPLVDPVVPLTLCRGREKGRDLSWAGFCLELGPFNEAQEVPVVRYTIRFGTGKKA
jgi:hypothetical protein